VATQLGPLTSRAMPQGATASERGGTAAPAAAGVTVPAPNGPGGQLRQWRWQMRGGRWERVLENVGPVPPLASAIGGVPQAAKAAQEGQSAQAGQSAQVGQAVQTSSSERLPCSANNAGSSGHSVRRVCSVVQRLESSAGGTAPAVTVATATSSCRTTLLVTPRLQLAGVGHQSPEPRAGSKGASQRHSLLGDKPSASPASGGPTPGLQRGLTQSRSQLSVQGSPLLLRGRMPNGTAGSGDGAADRWELHSARNRTTASYVGGSQPVIGMSGMSGGQSAAQSGVMTPQPLAPSPRLQGRLSQSVGQLRQAFEAAGGSQVQTQSQSRPSLAWTGSLSTPGLMGPQGSQLLGGGSVLFTPSECTSASTGSSLSVAAAMAPREAGASQPLFWGSTASMAASVAAATGAAVSAALSSALSAGAQETPRLSGAASAPTLPLSGLRRGILGSGGPMPTLPLGAAVPPRASQWPALPDGSPPLSRASSVPTLEPLMEPERRNRPPSPGALAQRLQVEVTGGGAGAASSASAVATAPVEEAAPPSPKSVASSTPTLPPPSSSASSTPPRSPGVSGGYFAIAGEEEAQAVAVSASPRLLCAEGVRNAISPRR